MVMRRSVWSGVSGKDDGEFLKKEIDGGERIDARGEGEETERETTRY